MPVYGYRCTECGAEIERRQSFSDAPLTTCETCGGKLRRLLYPAGVIFKGSGWYSTDSRSSGAKRDADGDAKAASTEKSGEAAASTTSSADKSSGDKASSSDKASSGDKASAGTKSGGGEKAAASSTASNA